MEYQPYRADHGPHPWSTSPIGQTMDHPENDPIGLVMPSVWNFYPVFRKLAFPTSFLYPSQQHTKHFGVSTNHIIMSSSIRFLPASTVLGVLLLGLYSWPKTSKLSMSCLNGVLWSVAYPGDRLNRRHFDKNYIEICRTTSWMDGHHNC